MLVQIQDRAALFSVSIVSLRAYLNSRGWTDAGMWGERPITIFAKEHDGRTWEVLVPHRDTIGGYAENMAESVAVLAAVEGRSQLDVFYDLKGAGADVIRIRSANGLANEPLSLGQSATLLNDTYKMLAASARAVERPQAAYRGKASANVESFLNRVQPLPSHQGYALTLHSPVPVEIGGQTDMGDQYYVPFSRQATYKLAEALGQTETAIQEAVAKNTLDPFKLSVAHGVSANLCASVSELAKKGQGIAIDLDWADVRSVNIPDSHFRFTVDSAEILQQASKSFNRNEPSHDEQIVAQIVQLAREPHEFDGRATIVSVSDDSTVRMNVEFDRSVYDTVINAFRDYSNISLMGDIHPTGRGYELRNPRNLLVMPEE